MERMRARMPSIRPIIHPAEFAFSPLDAEGGAYETTKVSIGGETDRINVSVVVYVVWGLIII